MQDSINVYKQFIVAAILGQISAADSIIRQYRSDIYRVAAYLQQLDPQAIDVVFRGLLIEPGQVRGGKPLQPEIGEFASYSEDLQVACWFAIPNTWIAGTLVEGRPNVVGWIGEHVPKASEIIFHHNQTKTVNDLPGPSLVDFARMLASNLDPARTAAEGPDWAMAQIGWSLNTQQEVILKKDTPLRLTRVEEYSCSAVEPLDKRFRYRPSFILAPPGLQSVGIQPGERLDIADVDYHEPNRLCPQCRGPGLFLTYHFDQANLLLMQCELCHQNMFGQS